MSKMSPIFSSMDEQAKELLLERSARLREQKQADEALEDGGWIAEFNLGGQAFALPLEQVVSASPLKGVSPVPLSKPGVIGILRHEGKVIRVLSLASLLGSRGWKRDPSVLLILRLAEETLAVDCEEIPRVGQLTAAVASAAREQADKGLVELNVTGGQLLRYLNLSVLLREQAGSDHDG